MDKISVNIATYPGREKIFHVTARQFTKFNFPPDIINVFLNNYTEVPGWLKSYPFNFHLGSGGSENKFFFVDNFDGYYLTCDDDLVYPKDYIQKMIDGIEKYNRTSVVGIHGYIFPSFPIKSYLKDKYGYPFWNKLTQDTQVHLVGTGTIAFHTSAMYGFSRSCLPSTNADDPYFSKWCMEHNIPIMLLSRKSQYLIALPGQNNTSIWSSYTSKNDHILTNIINSAQIYPKLNGTSERI